MARLIDKLSAAKVKSAGPGLHSDGGNLYLQVSPKGAKSWSFRFMLNGRSREMGLGPVHTIGLAEARSKAAEVRKTLLEGVDPIEVRQEAQCRGRIWAEDAEHLDDDTLVALRAHEGEVIRPLINPASDAAFLATERAAIQAESLLGDATAPIPLPVSWSDPRIEPLPGARCSCCRGNRWWNDIPAPRRAAGAVSPVTHQRTCNPMNSER